MHVTEATVLLSCFIPEFFSPYLVYIKPQFVCEIVVIFEVVITTEYPYMVK